MKKKKKIDIRKIVSTIIFHKFHSHHLIFKIQNIHSELRKKYKIHNCSFNEIHKYLVQLLKKGLIKYQDPYEEPTKDKRDRFYKIAIDTDILLWFMKSIEYGQKVYEIQNIKYKTHPKISIQKKK